MQVETIKIEALDKLVQEVETMKKPASSYKETKILTKEEQYDRDCTVLIVSAMLLAFGYAAFLHATGT